VTGRLAASQEGLSSMELVILFSKQTFKKCKNISSEKIYTSGGRFLRCRYTETHRMIEVPESS
jgi:hypothetical protein